MKNNILSLTITLILLCPSVSTGALAAKTARNSEKVYWKGESDGFVTTCTDKDLRVEQGGKLVYSAREDMRSVDTESIMGTHGVTLNQKVRLLSLVGPFLSFRYGYYSQPYGANGVPEGNHPGGETTYMTIDLRRPGKPIRALWSENAVHSCPAN